MNQAMSSGPPNTDATQSYWIYDSRAQQSFWYNIQNDTINYQDRTWYYRPFHVPRSVYRSNDDFQAYCRSVASSATIPQQSIDGNHYCLQQGSTAPGSQFQTHSFDWSSQPQFRTANAPQNSGLQAERNDQRGTYPQPIVPQVYQDADNQRFVNVRNPITGVHICYQTGPTDRITDPVLYQSGVRSDRMLIGQSREGDEEPLFEGFRARSNQFFSVGRVFLILWVEPAGESSSRTVITDLQSGISSGRHGERVYSKVRRFVVIRTADNYSSALPITTYRHQGVGKPGVNKSEHGVIYTGREPPEILAAEQPKRGEMPMQPLGIRVDPDQLGIKLDLLSRVDYGKVHTIQHNIKVKSFGKVNAKSKGALLQQFQNVWSKSIGVSTSPTNSNSEG